jgi:streptogramin lyase
MNSILRICLVVAAGACVSLSIHAAHAAPTSLYAVSGNSILELNPDNGATLGSFTPPIVPQNGGGSGLAFSGSELFYTSIDNTSIYRLNPTSGAVLGSFARPAAAGGIDALGFGPTGFGQTLFALDYNANRLYLLNPLTGTQYTNFLLSFDAIGGVDFNHVTQRVFVSDANGTIRQLDPNTAAVLSTITVTPFQYGIGIVGNRLFTTNSTSIYERNSSTGAIINTFPRNYPLVGALAGGPPVPEPPTIGLFLLGAAVLAAQRNWPHLVER